MVQAFLKRSSGPWGPTGWRGLPWLAAFVVILVAVPQARTLMAGGILGGIVIGALLILIRHQSGSGPRRGTPVVLFPRAATASTSGSGSF